MSRYWAGKALQTIREQEGKELDWKAASKANGSTDGSSTKSSAVKSSGFGASKTWVPILASPATSYVTLSK